MIDSWNYLEFTEHISAMAGRDRLMVRGGNEKQGAMVFFKKIGLVRFEGSALCVHALECIGGNHLNTQFSLAECKPVRILLRNRDNNLHGAGLKKSVNVRKIGEPGEEWAHPSASQCGFYVYCRRELFRSTAFFLEGARPGRDVFRLFARTGRSSTRRQDFGKEDVPLRRVFLKSPSDPVVTTT